MVNKTAVNIMDIEFINETKVDFLTEHVYPRLANNEKCFIVTANPEIVMKTRESKAYKNMVKQADYVVPDGVGIVMASKFQKQPIKERIPGYDLMLDLLATADKKSYSCYFLGAKEHVNKKVVEQIKQQYPNIIIAGYHHGYISTDDKSIVERIVSSNPDLIFVALGSPSQEEWITKHINNFTKGLFMGVGGSFDVIAGEVKRAPDAWINLNLEWLYRLLRQPFRWKRILKVIEFMARVYFKKE
ncbi:WecB/TagA/CpsF family glycosyltransferase [Virgibacillus pantothenticus]|uniref:WecB/TagA/CpsF family glycosyltransferase n=2 Tax=Virgibacillus pantothenticus TaxID=1473 RepID=UPI001C240BAF|nr:WecB/TagA/CpsF family glycosyltransferase [Virgibacillus pantothenticus]MBU8566625.1 WecB/TagA/CpsF family glycosyltransferase [Virgibacillus pantothenticus]MBU8599117.1 WecB/TagA/CpsF family glycosyltransferase [Virgibacillus pantothenticus]MBU8634782.1 WecB/TagA/CpsF family glycosyltransferase [Virgibacillus pantothenticus]MBU8641135.1 WecB/TagA/CpsF family glycosyltransferase [Virgibacillus pantothenticus]MBU8645213.1 WecB/TagA/CpsF family glycosyltransferase [Virgibacillus pantothenticu